MYSVIDYKHHFTFSFKKTEEHLIALEATSYRGYYRSSKGNTVFQRVIRIVIALEPTIDTKLNIWAAILE